MHGLCKMNSLSEGRACQTIQNCQMQFDIEVLYVTNFGPFDRIQA
jgi:hypothetical protein